MLCGLDGSQFLILIDVYDNRTAILGHAADLHLALDDEMKVG